MALPKPLAALSAHLRQQNNRRHRPEPPGLPPMPSDPMICRWCGSRRVLLIADDPQSWFCQRLCAPNEQAPYRVDCTECGCEFDTGLHRASTCPRCTQALIDNIETVERRTRVIRRDDWSERRRER